MPFLPVPNAAQRPDREAWAGPPDHETSAPVCLPARLLAACQLPLQTRDAPSDDSRGSQQSPAQLADSRSQEIRAYCFQPLSLGQLLMQQLLTATLVT